MGTAEARRFEFKIDVNKLTRWQWAGLILIACILSGGLAIGTNTFNVNVTLEEKLQRLEDQVNIPVNSTISAMMKEANYIVSTHDVSGTTYACLINGTDDRAGRLEYYSANVSSVGAAAFGNLTTNRTWKEKVVFRGNFSLTRGFVLNADDNHTIIDMTMAQFMPAAAIPNGTVWLTLSNCQDIEIMGGFYDGVYSRAVIPYTGGIAMTECENIIIHDVEIYCAGGIGLTSTNNTKIYNNRLLGKYPWSDKTLAPWISLKNSDNNEIFENYIYQASISLSDDPVNKPCKYNKIYRNTLWGVDSGARIILYGHSDYTDIFENEIHRASGTGQGGIYGLTNTGSHMSRNRIYGVEDSGDDLVSLAAQKDLVFEYNWLNASNGFAFNVDNTNTYDVGNTIVSHNIINWTGMGDHTGGGGIRAEGGAGASLGGLSITDNIICNPNGTAISILGWHGAIITGNSCVDNQTSHTMDDGIGMIAQTTHYPDNSTISNNFIFGATIYGVEVDGTNMRVSANTIEYCTNGIGLSGDNNSAIGNYVIDCGYGVKVWGNSSIIEQNLFAGTGTKDISISSSTKWFTLIQFNTMSSLTSPIANAGTLTLIRWNQNYRTEASNSQANTTATTFVFNHNLKATPVLVWASFNDTAVDSWTWTATSSQITITVTGTLSASTTCYWYGQTWNYQ